MLKKLGILTTRKNKQPLTHQQNAEKETFIDENNPTGPEVPWNWQQFYEYLSMAGLHESSAFHLAYPDNPPSLGYQNFKSYSETGINLFGKECID